MPRAKVAATATCPAGTGSVLTSVLSGIATRVSGDSVMSAARASRPRPSSAQLASSRTSALYSRPTLPSPGITVTIRSRSDQPVPAGRIRRPPDAPAWGGM